MVKVIRKKALVLDYKEGTVSELVKNYWYNHRVIILSKLM